MLDKSLLEGRRFKIWHYIVSHSHLLIRSSSMDLHKSTNIDLWFSDVRYVEAPVFLGEISLDDPTDEERARLRARTGKFFDKYQTTVIVSGSIRYFVVSHSVHIEENKLDLFQTPYDPLDVSEAFIQYPGSDRQP